VQTKSKQAQYEYEHALPGKVVYFLKK